MYELSMDVSYSLRDLEDPVSSDEDEAPLLNLYSLRAQTTSGDLNLMHDAAAPEKTAKLVRQSADLGFDFVAVNQVLMHASTASASAPNKRTLATIPKPYIVPQEQLEGRQIRQYSRITATVSDTAIVHHFLKHPTVQSYDVVAIRPADETIFNAVTKKAAEFDIVTFDCGAVRPSWLSKPRSMRLAVSLGLSFELTYSEICIRMQQRDVLRQFFANFRSIWHSTKGTGVVVSSGAQNEHELRGPLDLCMMAKACGRAMPQLRRCFTSFAERAVLKAQSRKTLKSTMAVQKLGEVNGDLLEALRKIPEFACEMKNGTESIEA